MHREDNSKYLLYIEPKASEKLSEPIEDEWTKLIDKAFNNSIQGAAHYSNLNDNGTFREGSGFKGFHRTECGERSSNRDYLLENGMITNSLAPFYIRWYRNSIPDSEINKIKELKKFYEIT